MISFPIHAKSEPADSNPNFLPIESAWVNCYDPSPEPADRNREPHKSDPPHPLVKFYGYVNAMQRQACNDLLEKLYMLQLATPLDGEAIKQASQDYAEFAGLAHSSKEFLKYFAKSQPDC